MIRWEVFTQDEREKINKLVSEGRFDLLGAVMHNSDPEKEIELQNIIDEQAPVAKILDSKVREEMKQAQMRGESIDTPEAEAEWNRKLEEEKLEHEAKVKEETKAAKVKKEPKPKPVKKDV